MCQEIWINKLIPQTLPLKGVCNLCLEIWIDPLIPHTLHKGGVMILAMSNYGLLKPSHGKRVLLRVRDMFVTNLYMSRSLC